MLIDTQWIALYQTSSSVRIWNGIKMFAWSYFSLLFLNVFRHLSKLSKQIYLSMKINQKISESFRSIKNPEQWIDVLKWEPLKMSCFWKSTDRMNVMIIIIVSPLIVAIKIDQHSFHIEIHSIIKMYAHKHTRVFTQSAMDCEMKRKKRKIICFKKSSFECRRR